MKALKIILFFVVTFSLLSSSCKETAPGEYTSKEAIFKLLQKGNTDLEENDVCINEAPSFQSLFVVGYFAYDRGCAAEKMFFNGHEIDSKHGDSKIVLNANGFNNNPEETIEKYHNEVINMYKSTVHSENDDFKEAGVTFSKAKTIKENGNYVSTAWVQRPSGMNPQNSYYLSKLTIDKDGNFILLEKTKQFSVSMFEDEIKEAPKVIED